MTSISNLRLHNQRISRASDFSIEEIAKRLGALQAQDYQASLWAIGLRSGSNGQEIERAVADKKIVRTWPMRGTLHFIPGKDIKWMLKLTAAKMVGKITSRDRNLGIDEDTYKISRRVVAKVLEQNKTLTREKLYQELNKAKINPAGQRGIHLLVRLSMEGLICLGPRIENQSTFVLIDEWIKKTTNFQADEALFELTRRYFTGHGPATAEDFAWWSGLKISEIKRAIEYLKPNLSEEKIGEKKYYFFSGENYPPLPSRTFLLPAFDEYLISYRHRHDVLHLSHAQKVVPGGNGMFSPIMVFDGAVIGTWKKQKIKNGIEISLFPFKKISKSELSKFQIPAAEYGRFLGTNVGLKF